MKKILLSFAALTTLSMVGMLFFNQGNLYSTSTGAPGPSTCSQSGCHNDGGPAQSSPDVFLTVKDSAGTVVTKYVAGAKYTVTFGKHNASAKVGFALSTNAGTLVKMTGDGNVQKMSSYLTHTFSGTAVTGGEASWSGTWNAPLTSGAVTLQLYINETNGNAQNTGDMIYAASTSLTHLTTGLNKLSSDIQFKVFPNPAVGRLFIALDIQYESPLNITVTSLDGKQTTELFNEAVAKGNIEKAFDISELATGIYLLKIQTTEGVVTQKIFVN